MSHLSNPGAVRGHVDDSAEHREYPHNELRRIIVCFLFDGSEKYTKMTLSAVNSFIATTPHISVGLLFPAHYEPEGITRQISDPSRISIRRYEPHFQNWNPTQYKLDIRKFAPEFTTVFWLDSDTIVYKDLTTLLYEFHTSSCKVAFLKDHVCFNPQFLNNWVGSNKKDPFIPQACFMGFKHDIVDEFFGLWENLWRAWIEPAPFANFPNPVPSFAGSAFCTEQYALGMVLESGLIRREEIYEIRRITFGLRGLIQGDGSQSSASSGLSSLEASFSGLSVGSSWSGSGEISWSGSAETSGAYLTSWSTLPFFSAGNWTSFSGSAPTSGFFETSGLVSFESSGFSSGYSFGGSFDFGQSSWSSGSFIGSSGSTSASGVVGFVPVDNIGGSIVHFYNAFYDQSSNWWKGNNGNVIPQLDQYWKSGSANFH